MSKRKTPPKAVSLPQVSDMLKGLVDKINAAEAKARVYEHALINVAKLAGLCHERGTGRPIHDVWEVAGRALDDGGSKFWSDVKELPYYVLDCMDDSDGPVVIAINKRKLTAFRKGKL